MLPLDLAMEKLFSTNVQAATDFFSQCQSCFGALKLALIKSNEQMASWANKHCRDIQLNIGDLIYVSTEHFPLVCQLSCKLALHWVGPFPIGAIVNSVAFRVQLLSEYGRVHPVFHVSYLRPYVGPALLAPPAALPLNDVAAREYEVEAILDSRLCRASTEYLVK